MATLNFPNDLNNTQLITETVLNDTGRNDVFSPEEATNVRVYFADLLGEGRQDALIVISFGPEATLMVVYTPAADGYEYVGELGYFYDIDNISFIRPENAPEDIILFRERNNQSVGSLEKNGFIRGYAFREGAFENVLSIDENVESWWNEGLVENTPQWSKITQTSKIKVSDDKNTVDAEKTQVYSTAAGTQGKTRPPESAFIEANRRVINERYNWNEEWKIYTLGEKIEKATGERVLVLKDFAQSPYVLTGDNFDKYRILRNNGTVAVVDYSELEEMPTEA